MEVITLQSGSAGNCVFVRSGETRILFDAGISGSKAESRLAEYGYDIRDCNALVLSHEHCDHISSVGVFHRKFGLPVYANLRTWNATRAKPSTGVCFVVEDVESGQRFGLLTDLGHVFSGLQKIIGSLDAVLIESNYDDAMLRHGPYPQRLKDRISGKGGHISNEDAAELLDACDASQLQWACLGHLSAENNSPDVALATHRERHRDRFPIFCADRDGALHLPKIKEPKFSLRANAAYS